MNYSVLMLLALAATLVWSPLVSSGELQYIHGAPRTEDGRFTNLKGEIGHGSLGVRAPFLLRRFGTYFRSGRGAPEAIANDGEFLRKNAKHSVPTVTWVGHATLLVQMQPKNLPDRSHLVEQA